MSEKELIAAGYHSYKPNREMGDTWAIAYQKRLLREDGGTRYFLDVKVWHHTDGLVGYEASLNANDGCKFFPMKAPIRVSIGWIYQWTVPQFEATVKEIHDRLETLDYERQD